MYKYEICFKNGEKMEFETNESPESLLDVFYITTNSNENIFIAGVNIVVRNSQVRYIIEVKQ